VVPTADLLASRATELPNLDQGQVELCLNHQLLSPTLPLFPLPPPKALLVSLLALLRTLLLQFLPPTMLSQAILAMLVALDVHPHRRLLLLSQHVHQAHLR